MKPKTSLPISPGCDSDRAVDIAPSEIAKSPSRERALFIHVSIGALQHCEWQ